MLRTGALFLTTLLLGISSHGAGALELKDCRISAGQAFPGIKARCGTLERRENPDDPESPLLAIRVAVVPALNLQPQPDPIVPLAGGPGQGAVQFYSAFAAAFERLRSDHDISAARASPRAWIARSTMSLLLASTRLSAPLR